jgi:hypothetical protein
MGAWNIFYFLPIVFIGSFYLLNLMLAVVSLAYNIEVENERRVIAHSRSFKVYNNLNLKSFKKQDFVPQKKNATILDIETLKAKMAENERKKEEKKNNQAKQILNESKTTEIKIITVIEKKTQKLNGVINSLGDSLERDDNEIANINSITLSSNLGKYNNLVQEGISSCRE